MANQVTRAVAMASLAMACGLVEQQGIDMQSETFSVLKSLNEFFYNTVSSSSQSQSSLGYFNKRLLKPQTDNSRSVKVCQVVKNNTLNVNTQCLCCSLV